MEAEGGGAFWLFALFRPQLLAKPSDRNVGGFFFLPSSIPAHPGCRTVIYRYTNKVLFFGINFNYFFFLF
jgi:hypothetical protein